MSTADELQKKLSEANEAADVARRALLAVGQDRDRLAAELRELKAELGQCSKDLLATMNERNALQGELDDMRAPDGMVGSELIRRERNRQILFEGWTAEHDDAHPAGDLTQACIAYALHAWWQIDERCRWTTKLATKQVLDYWWPWDEQWWKPGDPLRELVKAGALIAAEIDRIQREREKQ